MSFHPALRKATELGIGLTAIATLILAGCGGGSSSSAGGGGSVASTTTTVTPYKGRFSSGTVGLTDANGQAVTLTAGGTINASGVASVSFPSSVTYPLTVNVAGTYLDETTGASATMATGSPLMGMIPSASDAAAASGIPVTAVTHIARGMLPASGFSSASAVAAISGAASSVLGVGYSDAMLPPVFNGSGQTSDPTTLKLTALAHVIGQQGGSGDLGARLNNVAASLAAGSAVDAVLPQGNLNNALAALNQIGGASGVVPSGATPPTIPNFNPPGASLGNQIQAGIPVCAQGQVLMPTANGLTCVSGGSVTPTLTITGFSPTTGAVGTSVTITGTNLVTGFPPAPTVKFGTTNAGGPYTNVSNTGITFTVPAGLAAGTHTITVSGMSGTPVTVGTFTVTAGGAITLTLTPATGSNSFIVNSNTTTGGVLYQLQCETSPGFSMSSLLLQSPTTTGLWTSQWSLPFTNFDVSTINLQWPRGYKPRANTTYYCKIGAFGGQLYVANSLSLIALSDEVSITTASVNLIGLTATAASPSQIDLNWLPSTNGTSFEVYRSTLPNQSTSAMTLLTPIPTNGSSYTDSGLTAATAYYYKVVESNAYVSATSLEVSATTSAANTGTGGGTVTGLMGGAIQPSVGVSNIATNAGIVTSLAGGINGAWGYVDGAGTAARFYSLQGITTDGNNLYVADSNNFAIRKIEIATGMVTTLQTGLNKPFGITTDGSNLYVADTWNNKIQKIEIATGVVTTLAGDGAAAATDGIGMAASFRNPRGITTDGSNLYVADTGNSKIRKIEIATRVVTTLAGSGTGGSVDGTGTAASFYSPGGITTDGTNLYVADTNSNKIRMIEIATGVVTTLAGSGGFFHCDGIGALACFMAPTGITTDGSNLYVADTSNSRIRKIEIATGAVTTLAGGGVASSVNGTGTAATFYKPAGITTDGASLYVAEDGKIRRIQ